MACNLLLTHPFDPWPHLCPQAAVQTIDALTDSNDEALRELEAARAEADDSRRQLRTVQHERDRLAERTGDLATQVGCLGEGVNRLCG